MMNEMVKVNWWGDMDERYGCYSGSMAATESVDTDTSSIGIPILLVSAWCNCRKISDITDWCGRRLAATVPRW